jgi:hypothetical protein
VKAAFFILLAFAAAWGEGALQHGHPKSDMEQIGFIWPTAGT